MRGYVTTMDVGDSGADALKPWERKAVDAVGTAIEFWGFKHNHGRVWALLYLRGHALSSAELQAALGLSKGAASMILRELEQWGVLFRVRTTGSRAWRYEAEHDTMAMIRRVVETREAMLVGRIRTDLDAAADEARRDPDATDPERDRVARMVALADLMGVALELFTATARLDVGDAFDALRAPETDTPTQGT